VRDTPFGRMAEPDEIARVAVFLATEEAAGSSAR
jgi:NAD(P)-dependent dehydrogenase (short-subunit alcohol dehydrogenase family)